VSKRSAGAPAPGTHPPGEIMKTFIRIAAVLLIGLASAASRAEPVVGEAAPKLDIELIDGKQLTSRALEGKVVVYLFWATWCPVCAADLPGYAKLYKAYKVRGLEIVAVSLDEDKEDAAQFWQYYGYRFPVAMRSAHIREAFGRIVGTPTVYIVDRKGILRVKHLGQLSYEKLEARIRGLLRPTADRARTSLALGAKILPLVPATLALK